MHMRVLLAALLLSLAAGPALAVCPTIPDDASTHYVANQQAMMLCQQAELAAATAERARAQQFEAELDSRLIELQQDQRLRDSLASIPTAMPSLPQF